MAAHLERVAKLAESLAPKLAAVLFTRENRDDPQAPAWEELCADPEQETCVNAWLHKVTPLLPIVAAALAACAREASETERAKHLSAEEVAQAVNVAKALAARDEAKFWKGRYNEGPHRDSCKCDACERFQALERAVGEKAAGEGEHS